MQFLRAGEVVLVFLITRNLRTDEMVLITKHRFADLDDQRVLDQLYEDRMLLKPFIGLLPVKFVTTGFVFHAPFDAGECTVALVVRNLILDYDDPILEQGLYYLFGCHFTVRHSRSSNILSTES